MDASIIITREYFPWKSLCMCLAIWMGLVFPGAGCSRVSGSAESLEVEGVKPLSRLEQIQNGNEGTQVGMINTWYMSGGLWPGNNLDSSHPLSSDRPSKRTGPALVGSIMALLATFEAANVLPPEGTSQANQLIHGLIQLQSAIVKSQSSELRDYVSVAVESQFEVEGSAFLQSISQSGLTTKVLEAILSYDRNMPIWDQPAIARLLQSYNVSRADWQLIEQIFTQADIAYRTKGSSIHEAYEQWRAKMPKGR